MLQSGLDSNPSQQMSMSQSMQFPGLETSRSKNTKRMTKIFIITIKNIIMIRDTRRINIQTNFYDDDEYYTAKPHEQTFETNLLTRDRGAIALYNILDTVRLHRIVNAFTVISAVKKDRLRKYSSKEVFVGERAVGRGVGRSQDPPLRYPYTQEQVQSQQVHHMSKYGSIVHNRNLNINSKKRSQSMNVDSRSQSQSHYLRQSRKRILESINKALHQDKSDQRSTKNYGENKKSTLLNSREGRDARDGRSGKILGQSLQLESNQPQPSKDSNLHLKTRLQKLQRLMKNIRRQKQKKLPTIIHEKRQVQEIPKKQRSHDQMRKFIQEIQSLRHEMHEIKVINEEILQHSRERSARSSRVVSRSQSQAFPDGLNSIAYRNGGKRSEFLQLKKSSDKSQTHSQSNASEKVRLEKKKKDGETRERERDRDHIKSEHKNHREARHRAPEKEKNGRVQNQQVQISNKEPIVKPKSEQAGIQSDLATKPSSKPQKKAPSPAPVQKQPSNHKQYEQPKIELQPPPVPAPAPIQKQPRDWQRSYEKPRVEEYKPFNQIVYGDYGNDYGNSYGLAVGNKFNQVDGYEGHQMPVPPKPTSSQTRRLELQYKSSPWYREYGSPGYNPSPNPPMPPKPILQTLQPPPNPSKYQQTRSNPFSLQLLKLHEIKDAVSNSNANSSRTSNLNSLNSRTSSPRSNNVPEGNLYGLYGDYGAKNQYNIYGTNYPSPGSVGKSSGVDSDYTNPNLLKELNLGPFPKLQAIHRRANYEYQSPNSYLEQPKYTYKYSSSPQKQKSPQPSTEKGVDQFLKNIGAYTNPINPDKLSSFKTISDNDIGSYTYSKGSSAVTSMAKLEQEYEHIINDSPFANKSEDYPSYQPIMNPYNVGTGGTEDTIVNLKKLSSLEDQVNSYFANGAAGREFEYHSSNWVSGRGKEGDAEGMAEGYGSAYQQEFYDRYARGY